MSFDPKAMLNGLSEGMDTFRDKIENSTHTASAGGGVVTATVNGRGRLVSLSTVVSHSEISSKKDIDVFLDLVTAAITKAQDEADITLPGRMSSVNPADLSKYVGNIDIESIKKEVEKMLSPSTKNDSGKNS